LDADGDGFFGILQPMTKRPLHEEPIPFITLPNWIKAATQCGFNIEPIFRELGIETSLINLESATISRPLMEKVMEACVAQSRQQHFPFVLGETFAFEYLPDLATFLTTSPNLREALKIFDWVRELINPMINVQLVEQPPLALLVLAANEGDRPYFTESLFASIIKFSRVLLRRDEDAAFREMRFKHAPPKYAEVYRQFFGTNILFNQPHNAVVFDHELLDRPLEGAFPVLHQQAEYLVEQRLQRMPRRTGLVAAIEEFLEQKPEFMRRGIEAVAEQLGMGHRTLQRRVGETGESYADVLARVRYRIAMHELRETDHDLEHISEHLGFSDRRSFTRAFSRWSGVSPSRFRNR
jgi:AraC-like DNA-binding protein